MTTGDASKIVVLTALRYGLRVHQLRERAGNGKGQHWRLVARAKREAAVEMREQGASLAAIGRALGCGTQPVWWGLRKREAG